MATSKESHAKRPVATDSQLRSFQEQYKFTSKKRPAAAAASSSIVQAAPTSFHIFVRAGLPLIIFAVGSSYVLKSAVEGKNTERDKSRGLISKSERQARLDAERDDMVEKLNKKMKMQDFDNTKRIERPEEILERRMKEREERNRWYKRSWRWVTGQS